MQLIVMIVGADEDAGKSRKMSYLRNQDMVEDVVICAADDNFSCC